MPFLDQVEVLPVHRDSEGPQRRTRLLTSKDLLHHVIVQYREPLFDNDCVAALWFCSRVLAKTLFQVFNVLQ